MIPPLTLECWSRSKEFEAAGATYEIISYGSNVFSGFTEWSARSPGLQMYSWRADYRSWESTKLFLQELFTGLPAAELDPKIQCFTPPCRTTPAAQQLAKVTSHTIPAIALTAAHALL